MDFLDKIDDLHQTMKSGRPDNLLSHLHRYPFQPLLRVQLWREQNFRNPTGPEHKPRGDDAEADPRNLQDSLTT
jgi:hypothetical protein